MEPFTITTAVLFAKVFLISWFINKFEYSSVLYQIFAKDRLILQYIRNKIHKVISCPMCTNFWVMLFMSGFNFYFAVVAAMIGYIYSFIDNPSIKIED